MAIQVIPVPDIGGAEDVDVIEVCVAPGDAVDAEQSLIVLETEKASMEVPSPQAGRVLSLKVKEGDKVSEGDAIMELEIGAADDTAPAEAAKEQESEQNEASETESSDAEAATSSPQEPETAVIAREQKVPVPDLGGADQVDVIEVCVAEGDEVAEGDSLIVLETDKASMEVPSPLSGKILKLQIKEGDKVSQGDEIVTLATVGVTSSKTVNSTQAESSDQPSKTSKASPPAASSEATAPASRSDSSRVSNSPETEDLPADAGDSKVYAGPSVRKLARQLGVDLSEVKASGPRSRHTKDDIRAYVKKLVANKNQPSTSGSGIPAIPSVDFAQFGEIELVKMSKIKKVTVTNMVRNWLNVPHVTQFDDADITELERFRKDMKAEAEKRGVKLTPLPFLLKACSAALREEPSFNVSMHTDGEHIVQKHYVHIGIAVATPAGLMVPVIRDVDKKGLWELAAETAEMAKKARDGKLLPRDMQGACFTISSLGAMGGTGFTPIVNAPEVAILGVSKAEIKPVWNGSEFIPRQLLPLSLSYDHRAINGADAGRFFSFMVSVLGDIRRLLL